MATSNAGGAYKQFSGAGANGRDLKRRKTWCLSNMITMTTLTKEARGPFVHSMLDGDALTAVDGGENLIFNTLEMKNPIERACKALFDVFEVSAREGERVFHACQRDA